MPKVEYHYNNVVERQQIIRDCEAQKMVMLHDTYALDWQPNQEIHGILTFVSPNELTQIPQPARPRDAIVELDALVTTLKSKGVI